MSLTLFIELAWKSTLCAGLTLLILAFLSKRSAAERSRVAHAGLAVILLLPLTLFVVPDLEVRAPEPVAHIVAATPVVAEPVVADTPSQAPAEQPPAAGLDFLPLLPFVPGAVLLLLTLVALLRLQLLRSRSDVLCDPRWLTALAATQRRFGFKHGTALLVSRDLSSPISWGVMRPVILLDERAAADPREAEAIIAHELAHVARLDWAKLLIGRAATALFWFNPLVWILAARCHELREEAADDAVLRTDFACADYAQLLVGVARHENRAMLLAANGVAPSRGSLGRRVRRVLDGSRSRVPARLGWTVACVAGALLVNAPLAALTLTGAEAEAAPAAAVPVRTPAAPAEKKHSSPQRIFVNSRDIVSAGEPSDSPSAPQSPALAESVVTGAARSAASIALAEALIEAAERGNLAAMAELIEAGASPNSVLDGDGTPLIAAAHAGRADAVAFLLARGAHVNLAVRGDGNPLIAAAGAGRTDIVRLLLERGADIEAAVPDDENALITASRHGRTEVVRLLIARGADVNRKIDGRTPLAMAQAGGHTAIAALLREAGATR